MTLSFGMSPWLLILSALLSGVLSYWLYRRTTPVLPTARRILLGSLRFAVLFLIFFLLLEPVLRLIDSEERPPVVAVLIDDSESLRITSTGDSAAVNVRNLVRQYLSELPAAMEDADIRFYRFGSTVDASSVEGIEPESLQFRATRTNISLALEGVRELLRDENLRATVLVSDGQFNTGRNPLYAADRYPVPIFTAVLGDTSRHVDVQVRRVTTNQIAYVGTELPVQVGIRSEGLGGEPVSVSLLRGGDVLSSQRITLPEGSSEITVDLSVEPEVQGLHQYTVAVTRLSGEVTFRNNEESVAIRVLESRRRVLLVSSAPGPDVAAIRQLIGDDPTFAVSAYVQRDEQSFYGAAFPARLDTFDVIVMAGFPGSTSSDAVARRIAAAAEAGVPILFVLSTNTNVPLLNAHFSAVLPVTADRVREGFVEAALVPTAEGATHPVMQIPEAAPQAWLRYPPLASSQTRWTPSPDATILATTSVRGVELGDPLLVLRRRSANRSAALLGAGTWRWHNVPEDLSDLEHLWPSLFSNTIQWLTAREDDRPVRVQPTRDLFGGGEAVQLSGQVYDESLNPVSDASLEVEITAPDGSVLPYVMNPIGNGRYTLEGGTLPQGTYDFEAVATHQEEALGSDRGNFAVGSLTLEFKETRANAALMRQIAQRSGGQVLDPVRSDLIANALSSSANLASLVVEHETELELRRRAIFLALIVLLLTTEWFLRKRSGMV